LTSIRVKGCSPKPPGYSAAVTDYSVVKADQVEDAYADSDVPGEFHSLTEALGAEQLAVTLIRIPPHSDFEQGTGHRHSEIEEVYLLTRGTLTMRFGDEIETVGPGSAVRGPAGDGPLAPQRGRGAGRALGDLPSERERRRREGRQLLGGLARGVPARLRQRLRLPARSRRSLRA
jgi:mannose-6-phosphate isomerase-like protein (cupin superfamily)